MEFSAVAVKGMAGVFPSRGKQRNRNLSNRSVVFAQGVSEEDTPVKFIKEGDSHVVVQPHF